mmetsp:Transcript_56375/g.163545  ORF Transcript_56375/g.163545 Transcript_56375/m.163545 type:complete len:418 (+) Transcript_56375:72-1325(+)
MATAVVTATLPMRGQERVHALPQTCRAAALGGRAVAPLQRGVFAAAVSSQEAEALPRLSCAAYRAQGDGSAKTVCVPSVHARATLSPKSLARVPRLPAVTSTLARSALLGPMAAVTSAAAQPAATPGAAVPPLRRLAPPLAQGNLRLRSTSPPVARRSRRRNGMGSALAAMGVMPVTFKAGDGAGQPIRLLCYGDSLTVGFYDAGRQYEPYGKMLAEALSAAAKAPVEVHVCGHSGHTAQEMVADLDSSAVEDVGGLISRGLRSALAELPAPPDLAVIMAGTNDIGSGSQPSAVIDDIGKLHAVCHAAGVSTVALAPPAAPKAPSGSSFERARTALVDSMRLWARSTPATKAVVNPAELVPASDGSGAWDPDKLHLGPAGSKRLGSKLALLIAPLLAQPATTLGDTTSSAAPVVSRV